MFKAELTKYCKLYLFEITVLSLFIFYLFIYLILQLENVRFYVVSRHLFYSLFVPTYIVILTRMIGENEHDHSNWKNIMIAPKKKIIIFIEKFILTQGIVLLLYLLYTLFTILLKDFYLKMDISNFEIILDICRSFFYTLPITLFFFIISIEEIPLLAYGAFATISMVANILISQTNFWKYFPLTYPLLANFYEFHLNEAFSISFFIFTFLLLIGILRFYQKNW